MTYRSNPTSPTQQVTAYNPPTARTYHPAMRVYPPPPPQSPQIHRKPTVAPAPTSLVQQDARRRPMSFVRALEMSDSVEMTQPRPSTPDRTSVYDMNYEISV